MEEPNLAVLICTRERPESLRRLLESINRSDAENLFEIKVFVIENDPGCSSEKVVKKFSKISNFPVSYIVEPKMGIPLARNRGLKEAWDYDFVYFVDDDQEVLPDTLRLAYLDMKNTNAQVVKSSVEVIWPESTPEVIKLSGEKFLPDGSKPIELGFVATNGVLVDMLTVRKNNILFDEERAFVGGTDTQFFRKLKERGAKIIKSSMSKLFEYAPFESINISYHLKRSFKSGYNNSYWMIKNSGCLGYVSLLVRLTYWLIKGLTNIIISLFSSNKEKNFKGLIYIYRVYGGFYFVVGRDVDTYREVVGK